MSIPSFIIFFSFPFDFSGNDGYILIVVLINIIYKVVS